MKSLLIVNTVQFGYQTDYLKYSSYLNEEFEITYLCYNEGLDKIEIKNVEVVYLKKYKNKIIRNIHFYIDIYKMNNKNWDIIFIKNSGFNFIIRFLIRGSKYMLDIRTVNVSPSFKKRLIGNLKTKFNTLFFKNISIISHGVAKKYNLNKYLLLPLGSDTISKKSKTFYPLRLFYVGTFNNRNIHETIEGIFIFLQKNENMDLIYDIFGMGTKDEIFRLGETIDKYDLKKNVKLHGRKNHQELKFYFDNCNIGVSYVPMTKYYEFQPPTKTFEYILSGMICLGTNTNANSEIINEINGVLCNDNPQSFADSLQRIFENRNEYDSELIKNTLEDYSWENITKNILKPYLKNL